MEEPEAKHVGRILSIEGLANQLSTMQKQPNESSYVKKMKSGDARWRRKWLDGRLNLQPYHSEVKRLEDAIWDFCVGICASPRRGNRVLLWGTNGNGKTRSMKAIARWVRDRAIDLPLDQDPEGEQTLTSCVLVNWAERVDAMKAQQNWNIEDLIAPTVTLIDDVGAEHDPSAVGKSKLYLILEARLNRWTMLTTNLEDSQWGEMINRRVADRFFRNCEQVDLSKLPSFSAR